MGHHCEYCGDYREGNNIVMYSHVSDLAHQIHLCSSCVGTSAEQVYANFRPTYTPIADWE